MSWRGSLPLPTDPVWRGSMHAILSYHDNRPTHKHTHQRPTNRQDRLQYTAPQLASAQCKNVVEMYHRMRTWAQTKWHRVETPETYLAHIWKNSTDKMLEKHKTEHKQQRVNHYTLSSSSSSGWSHQYPYKTTNDPYTDPIQNSTQ